MVDNPGPFQLTKGGNAFAISGAGTIVGDWITGFDGIDAASFQIQFIYGAGGSTVFVYIQTSIDQGQTPIDIWAEEFTTSSGTLFVNLSALDKLTTPTVPSNLALGSGATVDGILGDRFRAVVVSTGTYTGATIANVTGQAR